MKTALNVLAVGACVVWAGALYLGELGRSYGNAPAHLSHGEVGAAVVLLVSLAVVACVVASRRTEGDLSWALAASPFALLLVAQAFLGHRVSSAQTSRDEEQEARARMVQSRFDEIPAELRRHRDSFGEFSELLDSVLVIDADTQSLVRVDHERQSLLALCVGRIDGSTLELYGDTSLEDYTDSAGRTVYDRFTVVRADQPERPDCNYERYSF
jgi:hypothetical protein